MWRATLAYDPPFMFSDISNATTTMVVNSIRSRVRVVFLNIQDICYQTSTSIPNLHRLQAQDAPIQVKYFSYICTKISHHQMRYLR